jgi:hypothetical protein
MTHIEQCPGPQEGSSAFSRLTLRAFFIAVALLCFAPGRSTADLHDEDAYPVKQVRAFAAGKWHVARLTTGGTTPQFVVDFEPDWPIKIPLEVTWGSDLIVPEYQKICRDLSSAVSRIKVEVNLSSGWQAQPGHPTHIFESGLMRYTVSNVNRTSPVTVRASCEYTTDTTGDVHRFSGVAKIRFEPKDPLSGWDPGLPKDIENFSIFDPNEGESISPTTAFFAQVKCPPCAYAPSVQITLEVEKATKYQTGTVGDLALPPGKPYVTEWKKIVTKQYTLSFNSMQYATLHLPGSLSEKAVRTVTVHHDPGWYRLRLMSGSKTTPWRTFQIYNPIKVMPKVQLKVSPRP